MAARQSTPVWLWPNILSLDAPCVALIWQDFLARLYHAPLLTAGRSALGLTVWAIYLTDRLLDVRHPQQSPEPVRHGFYRANNVLARSLLALVFCADLFVALHWLRPLVFDYGLVIAAGVAGYLGIFPLLRTGRAWLKKVTAALFFTSGVFLIPWIGTNNPMRTLSFPAIAFCTLCLANLVMIERRDRSQSPVNFWIWIALLLAIWQINSHWFAAIAISAVCLAVLALSGNKLSRNACCVLADAALLSPLLFN